MRLIARRESFGSISISAVPTGGPALEDACSSVPALLVPAFDPEDVVALVAGAPCDTASGFGRRARGQWRRSMLEVR